MTLGLRFVESARRQPSGTALVVGDERISYNELLHIASGLRSALEALPRPSARVGLMCKHSLALYLGALAAALAERPFMPLRPEDPRQRQLGMLREAAPSVLICDESTAPLGRELAAALDPPPSIVVPTRNTSSPVEAGPAAPSGEAYLMYTSGSTGAPKGVPVTGVNVDSTLTWAEGYFDLTEEDRFANTFEPSFDLWVFSTFVAWNAGATVVDLSPEERLAPGGFLERERVTVWFSTPTHARLIRQLRGLAPGGFPSLRWSLFCGEPLTMADAVDWQRAAPNSQVENLYGPTEVTLVCAAYRFPKPALALTPDLGAWAPIGGVFPHLSHRVVDDTGEPVPEGEEGELWVAGQQVFGGYLGRPEEDTRCFADVASADAPPERFYQTGDIVRADTLGRLRFVRRLDSQVKIMGHRIELGELETRAMACAGVENAVAATYRQEASPFRRIVLALVGAEGIRATVERELAAQLPPFMQPSRIVRLEAVPTTPSGKVDRRRLSDIGREVAN